MHEYFMKNIGVVMMVMSLFLILTDMTTKAHAETETPQATLSLMVNQGTLIKVERPASAVFVADPTIADVQVKTPKLIYIFARQPGKTNLYAVDDQEDILLSQIIHVQFETSRLEQAIRDMLPQASIRVDAIHDSLVLRGNVDNASDAATAVAFASSFVGAEQNIINQIKITGPNQVNLQVTVAEMSRNTLKDLGLNWETFSTFGNFVLGLATGSPVLAGSQFLNRQNGSNSVGAGYRGGSSNVNVLINALEDEGIISVLAKPNLTALSGETASFLAGGEFPVPVAQEDGRTTVEFRQYGVSLAFTPTLIGNNRISLRVRPEVSQLTNIGAYENADLFVPALSTRRAETTVEMGSGQSFAIAGLLQETSTQSTSSIPGVNKVPVASPLFEQNSLDKRETELVIIVTPYIVQPTTQKLATPLDGYKKSGNAGNYTTRAAYVPPRPNRKPAEYQTKSGLQVN